MKVDRFPTFKGLTLTLDQVILHTVVNHSSTSTSMPNFIEIEVTLETFCGWTDVQTDEWKDRAFETNFIRSTQKSQPKNRHLYTEIGTASENVQILISSYHSAGRRNFSEIVGSAKSKAHTSNPRRHSVVSTDGSRYQMILHVITYNQITYTNIHTCYTWWLYRREFGEVSCTKCTGQGE